MNNKNNHFLNSELSIEEKNKDKIALLNATLLHL